MSKIIIKLENKRICLLGFGSDNQALLKWLIKNKITCQVAICDQKKDLYLMYPEFNRDNIAWELGPEFDKKLERFDIIIRVPGYPLFSPALNKAKKAGVELSSPIKLFFEICRSNNVIGVTGTKGKGTTSGLIVEMLNMAAKKVFWGGNIGIPVFGFLDKIKKDDWVVLELSSFQLEDLEVSPKIAVITNLSKEHLAPADPFNPNYHLSMRDYTKAKLNIIKFQGKNDFAVLNKKIDFSKYSAGRGKFNLGKGKKIYFTSLDYPSRLVGNHNRENIAAAAEAVRLAGVKKAVIKKAAKKFKGLEHRLEFSGEKNRVKYYNDSFATTPESAITAINSFLEPIILLAGGADKGSNFKELAKKIKERVKFLILFEGKGSVHITQELKKINFPIINVKIVASMKEAMGHVHKQAKPGDVILLSPACASFGVFQNYKERGRLFKEEVKRLS